MRGECVEPSGTCVETPIAGACGECHVCWANASSADQVTGCHPVDGSPPCTAALSPSTLALECVAGATCQSGECALTLNHTYCKAQMAVGSCTQALCAPYAPDRDNVTGCRLMPMSDGTTCHDAGDPCVVMTTCQNGTCSVASGQSRVCAVDNACATATCNSSVEGGCVSSAVECPDPGPCQYALCDAGGSEQCQTFNVSCSQPPPSASSLQCLQAMCNASTDQCELVPVEDGTPCVDNNTCSIVDVCMGGVCVPGDLQQCGNQSNASECVVSICNASAGGQCQTSTHPSIGMTCMVPGCATPGAFVCSDDGTRIECNATTGGNCTAVPCNVTADCPAPENACDKVVCSTMAPTNGTCVYSPLNDTEVFAMCDDNNVCTREVCNRSMGGGTCAFEVYTLSGMACDDGDECTDNTICHLGACTFGVARTCDDGNDCTDDTCVSNVTGGCVFSNRPAGATCDLSLFCTPNNTCNGLGSCQMGAVRTDCPAPPWSATCMRAACNLTSDQCELVHALDGTPCGTNAHTWGCLTAGQCNETTGQCEGQQPNHTLCQTANPCTNDTCTVLINTTTSAVIGSECTAVALPGTSCVPTTNISCQTGSGICLGSVPVVCIPLLDDSLCPLPDL